jgi:hypothetical protein
VRLRCYLPLANSLWFFAGCQGRQGCGHVAPIGVRAAIRLVGLAQIPGVVVEDPDTNPVFFDIKGAGVDVATLQRLIMRGVRRQGAGLHASRRHSADD